MRTQAMEDVAISDKLNEVNRLFTLAEKYDPDNSFINYWHAQILFRYTPPEDLDKIRDELMREIHAGNNKHDNEFVFGAPLPPRLKDVKQPILTAEQTDPVYIDQWVQFGSYSGQTLEGMVGALLPKLSWPRDKDEIADLMYMYYNLGRTIPYDRSYFSMQQQILNKIRHDVNAKSPEQAKLAAAGRFLDEQYQSVANKLYDIGRIKDSNKVNEVGINEQEESYSRQMDLPDYMQGPQAAYLERFAELTGVKFPLPEDKTKW
jgi:hypothetical protein